MKGDGRALLGGVLVATAGSQLCDSLDSNFQGFRFISGDVLRHTPTQILHWYPHRAVLREHANVESHAHLPFKGL